MSMSSDGIGPAPPEADVPVDSTAGRRVVFVVGSGRSGTSALSGALQILGLHVPQPEVVPDETNPKGFGESQWVVDFHHRLLRRCNVLPSDARPSAWFDAGKVSTTEQVREELTSWLGEHFEGGTKEILIKDPRLVWFVGLWRSAATRLGATSSYVIMLRPPLDVVGSKKKYYASAQGELSRIAAWLNLMLHTERATRGAPRMFVAYHSLLEDWTVPVYSIGETFDLAAIKGATAADIRKVHSFIDPSLNRVRVTEPDGDVPKRLLGLVDETWRQLITLLEENGDNPDTHAALDELRREYLSLYDEAEGIAQSTALAVRRQVERQVARENRANPDGRLRRLAVRVKRA
jgi:hypothetical protein